MRLIKINRAISLAAILLCGCVLPINPVVIAEDPGHAQELMAHSLVPGFGYAELFDDQPIAFWSVEVRPRYRFYGIGSWFFFGTGADEGRYAAAGILADIMVGPHWVITPAFGAGYYREGAEGPDLGYDAEFRSSIEVSWRFKNGHRLGLMLAHLSNGSLSDVNPGTESLQLNWLIPLGR
jgi:hypothetical protein